MKPIRVWMLACVLATLPVAAFGQGRQTPPSPVSPDVSRELERVYNQTLRATPASTDVLSGPVVTDAPFSADATTTVTQILGDGTRIEQTTTSRFFRDRTGRVRREQTIVGLGPLNGGGNTQTITVDPDPGDGTAYMLDPMTRTARRVPRMTLPAGIRLNFNGVLYESGQLVAARTGGPGLSVGNRPSEESLGTRQFEGVKAIGRKTTTTIPTGQIGNDRAIEITDERWESPELRMLVYSRTSDPRTGVVEYRLTNINRAEPPAELFMVPPEYTISEPTGGRGGRGAREGGAGPVGR